MLQILILSMVLFISCDYRSNISLENNRPIVVFTFDDAHHTVYDKGYKIMREYDTTWHATHFYPITYIDAKNNITLEQAKEMENHGWENGGHGVEHENLSSIPLKDAEKQILESIELLQKNSLKIDSWDWAYGNYNDSLIYFMSQYIKNIRTSHDVRYSGGIERLQLGYFAVRQYHTTNDLIMRLESSYINGDPLVIFGFHAILDDNNDEPGIYYTHESVFREFLSYLKDNNYQIYSVREAMNLFFN